VNAVTLYTECVPGRNYRLSGAGNPIDQVDGDAIQGGNMNAKFNLWIEVNGKVALSIWRADLLRAVAETGSITSAALQMKVQYRTAWVKIHEMEKRLGTKLIYTRTGGQAGGGSRLTPAGEDYVAKMARFHDELEAAVADKYEEIFGAPSGAA
jgi:molybdate transport system regulatory protein